MENQIETIAKESENILAKVQEAAKKFPIMVDKCERANAALSNVGDIKTDEEDAKVAKLLVKVGATYNLVKEMRLEITKPLDELKKKLMEPEKLISNIDAASNFTLVKKKRDKYANDKYQEQQKEELRIKREKDEKEEIVRLSAAVEKAVFNGITDALYNLDQSVVKHLEDLTLENFDAKESKLKLKPKLKEEVYNGWFNVDFDSSKINQETYDKFIENAKKNLPYTQSNTDYIKSATEVLKTFIDSLPAKKKDLLEMAEMEKNNAAEAAKRKKEQQERLDKEQKEKEEKLAEDKRKKEEELDLEARNKQVELSFDAQVSLQSQEKMKNVRTKKRAIIDCKPAEIAQVFAKVIFACFSSTNFKGYLKTDKEGKTLEKDENGIPQYEKWAEELLNFYAENSDMKIDGVKIKEVISTIQKK
jgi:hypothetical protein